MKFDIKSEKLDNVFRLAREKSEWLFAFGLNDIIIPKKDSYKMGECKQMSFDYNGLENSLTGGNRFDIRRKRNIAPNRNKEIF